MSQTHFKEAILCLMFAMAEADNKFSNDELTSIVTMKEIFKNYSEASIMQLYREYKSRFGEARFTAICNIMVPQIPQELHTGTLSVLADIAVTDMDLNIKETSLISIVANTMGLTDVTVKTIMLTALSKKLLMNLGKS